MKRMLLTLVFAVAASSIAAGQEPTEKKSVSKDNAAGSGAIAQQIKDLENQWNDAAWMADRKRKSAHDAPVSIYEVHLGSWRGRESDGSFPTYDALAEPIADHALAHGFTHVDPDLDAWSRAPDRFDDADWYRELWPPRLFTSRRKST